MKKKKKIIILGVLALIIILIVCLIVFSDSNQDKNSNYQVRINENGDIDSYYYNDIEISDSSLIIDSNNLSSQIVLSVKNTSSEEKDVKDIGILIKDKKGNIVSSFLVSVNKKLSSSEKYRTSVVTNAVIEDAYYIEYQIN